MAYINFVIPHGKHELLSDTDDQYFVKNVIRSKEIHQKLRESKQCLKDEGAEFILENFDTYFSVLLDGENLPINVVSQAGEDLSRAATELDRNLMYLLEDKDILNDEVKAKYLNILKMLMYVYTNLAIVWEKKIDEAKSQNVILKRSHKKTNNNPIIPSGKNKILLSLISIAQRDIDVFWDPPVVEAMFVNLIAEVCYRFLEFPSIKSEKEARSNIFNLLGTVLKKYNHGNMFVMRMVNLVKLHEHLTNVVPDGIRLIIQNYNCKGLLKEFIKEITEWQTDEKYNDAQGSRLCCTVLSEMAILMPDLMVPEVMYLNDYLGHESYSLRISVLNVIVEVVLNVLTKEDLSEEDKESRDELLGLVEEHILDVSAHVRSKVFQFWTKLQNENAIPKKLQTVILEKTLPHLKDKGALVRKNAANCVTTFLITNPFSGELQLSKLKKDLEIEKEKVASMKDEVQNIDVEAVDKYIQEWKLIEDKVKDRISKKLNDDDEFLSRPCSQASQASSQEKTADTLRLHLKEGRYEEAIQMCLSTSKEMENFMEIKETVGTEKLVELLLVLMRTIYVDRGIENEKSLGNEEQLKEIEGLERNVEFLEHSVLYLKLIDQAIEPMKELLESQTIGDMQEAIAFFVAAFQFKIERAQEGVYSMLKMMKRNDTDRKDAVVEAFKKIYLLTDADNIDAHANIITKRLLELVKMVPVENYDDLCNIVSQWVAKGILDNNIINVLWNYVTGRTKATDEELRLAMDLLYMCAKGRWIIIEKNKELVHQIVFVDKEVTDMLLVRSGCRLLSLYSGKLPSVTDKDPPVRIKTTSALWKDLINTFVSNFTKKVKYFNGAMTAAIELIYKACSAPDTMCEELIEKILKAVHDYQSSSEDPTKCEYFIISRFNHLLGELALKHLSYLDVSVYRELKRRNHVREERKNEKKKGKKKQTVDHSASQRNRRLTMNATLNSTGVADDPGSGEESSLEGAQAEDTDVEFILNILENNTVNGGAGLGKLAHFILQVCENLDDYNDVHVQNTSVIALLRYMLVSSKFCEKNLRLIFTILERTPHIELKCSILIHCADLLERFPNVVEPWTPRMYDRLKDEDFKVRHTAFYVLANLILRDMIRVQTHIAQMAFVIVDPEDILRKRSKEFFITLSHKANNLYNALPDIFSHLCEKQNMDEDNLRSILKFLFSLIDKNKQMENLVDRFCSKFQNIDNVNKYRNIAYCLTLITYNDKGLRKLSENFRYYRHVLHDNDTCGFFKQILTNCTKGGVKTDHLKPIIDEIEEKINSVFELNEDGQPLNPSQSKPQFKKPRGAPRTARKGRNKKKSSSESSEDDSSSSKTTKKDNQRSTRKRVQKHKISFSDSDSD